MSTLPTNGGGIGGTGDAYGVHRRADLDPALPLDTPDDPECLRGLKRWMVEGGEVVLFLLGVACVVGLLAQARFGG